MRSKANFGGLPGGLRGHCAKQSQFPGSGSEPGLAEGEWSNHRQGGARRCHPDLRPLRGVPPQNIVAHGYAGYPEGCGSGALDKI